MFQSRARGWSGTVVGVVGLLLASEAKAAPGDHIRAGDAVITPSVMTGVEYHSNIYLADGSEQNVFGGAAWILKPELAIALEGKKVQLDFGVGWGIKKFLDFDEQVPNLYNADRFSDLNASLGVAALTNQVVGARFDDKFDIENLAGELPTATSSANIVHISNDANGGLVLHPGSALAIDVLGNFGVDRYTLPEALAESGETNINNRMSYGPVVNASWQFLPKTKVIGTVSVNWTDWENNLVTAIGPEGDGSSYGAAVGKPNAMAWRTSWGVNGQFTSKLALNAQLGYGQMYYDETTVVADGSSFGDSSSELEMVGEETFARDLTSFSEGLLVNTAVVYSPLKNHKVTLGYRKDFQDAFFTNYVAYNYLYLRYQGLYLTRLGLSGEVTYRIDAFHGEISRDDQNLNVKVGAAYALNSALSASLALGWTERACLDPECESGTFYASQYDDFWGNVGVTFTY